MLDFQKQEIILYIGKVRIFSSKKPSYSLLCSEDIDTLPPEEKLRVLSLCTGYTIEQAARAVCVPRRKVMNYELGKVKRMKAEVVSRLIALLITGANNLSAIAILLGQHRIIERQN